MTGKLFVCATPIGNLEDSSIRLLRVLKEADLIAAEDTRHTKKLLEHFEIQIPTTSYHEHNIKGKTPYIIEQILQGKNIAIVSDAGMPGISDPGEELIREAIENDIDIKIVPGPSAVVSALAVSGLDTKRFVFEGFLPREGKMRRRILRAMNNEQRTMVFYESPHRLTKSLTDVLNVLGNRKICIAREMTKMHEEIFRGAVEESISHFSSKEVLGEITMVIEGKKE